MARPILLSNGRLHVGINLFGMVHDLYYPYVGLENHARAENMRHRIGIWVEGEFSWLDDGNWQFAMDYAPHAQIGHITASHAKLGVTLEFLDCVSSDDDVFVRNIQVINASDKAREIRLFLHQVFMISTALTGDTAQYLPGDHAILHFKGPRHFVISGQDRDGQPFDQHSLGEFNINGKEGTYRDAEDGVLSTNEVEFGRVDSVIGYTLKIGPFDSSHVEYWMAMAKTQWEAIELHRKVKKSGLAPIFEATAKHWRYWLAPAEKSIENLDPILQAAFRRSLLLLAAHIDHNGSVIASTDTTRLNYRKDSYAYAWARDGCYAIWPLIRMGYKTEPRNFFRFCVRTLHPDGFLMQKFRPDGALGSTWHPYIIGNRPIPPIQEDETALVLYMIGEYYDHNKDKEFLAEIYEAYVLPAANFMAGYIDEQTKLPHASFDLWEEKFLTTTYSVSVVYAALLTAVRLAEVMQRPGDAVKWQTVADDIPEAARKLLFNEETQYFYRGFVNAPEGMVYNPTIDASSLYGAYMYGLWPRDSKQLKAATETLAKVFHFEAGKPTISPRYEHDQYYTVDPAGLGNPWYVTSLWMAEYDMQLGNLQRAQVTIDWVRQNMYSTGMLAEQINPFTLAPTSVAPLAWSQAEFLSAVLDMEVRRQAHESQT